jgi:hypothetical protein
LFKALVREPPDQQESPEYESIEEIGRQLRQSSPEGKARELW